METAEVRKVKVLAIGIKELPLDDTGWSVVYCASVREAERFLERGELFQAVVTTLAKGWPDTVSVPVLLVGATAEEALEAGADMNLADPPGRAELLLHLRRMAPRSSLGLVLDGLGDAFAVIDRTGRYVYVNQMGAELSGLAAQDMVGREIQDIFPSLPGTDFWEHLQAALHQGREARFRRRSALNQRVYEHRMYPLRFGVALVSTDVTDTLEQEVRARETERRLAAVFAETEQFMAILDRDFNVLELNRRALEQKESDSIVGGPLWAGARWAPYKDPLRDRLRAALEGRSSQIEISYRDDKDDTRVMDCTISPVGHKKIDMVVIQGLDQTERRRSERHLRCLAEAGQTLASSLDYTVTLGKVARLAVPEIADWATVYLLEDDEPRLLALAHIDPRKIDAARSYNERFPPQAERSTGVVRVIETGEPEWVEEITDEMIRASARDEDHLEATLELNLKSYICVPLIARDRTIGALALLTAESGRRLSASDLQLAQQLAARAALAVDNSRLFQAILKATRELEAARDEALRANRMKSAFLANMSHEIRTPMNGIRGMLEFLEEMDIPEQGQEYLATIRQCSDSLLYILNDILDLSRIEAGKLEISWRPFPLRQTLRSTVSLFRHSALEKGLDYRLEVDESVPDAVIGDSDRLRQILGNLLSNAVKFTERGSIEVFARFDAEEERLRLRVVDTGPGIPEGLAPHLFEPFSQGDESSTRRFGGTGLGLSIVKKLAVLMGGDVNFAPNPPGGAVFEVEMPAKVTGAMPEASEMDESFGVPRGLEVLLVEDNPVNRRVLGLQLAKLKCKVESAADGLEALKRIQSWTPDLILMDCQMPNLDGYEATRRIRKMPLEKQPRIIALTAHAMKGEREKCLDAGMDDFLPKPISLRELTRVLSE